MERISQPLTIFLIGTTGDLAKKKILKAVYKLFQEDLLPEKFYLVGNARTEFTHEEYTAFLFDTIKPESLHEWRIFQKSIRYISGDVSRVETFKKFSTLEDDVLNSGNHLWYVATLPHLYQDVVRNLYAAHVHKAKSGWTKFLLEKPFGINLNSSRELNAELEKVFEEEQIYRIDHFLAKETVQNILVFRFANGIFENLWNRKFIDHIQINATETLGIAGREAFYDATGTVRDVIQNHVLQMLAVTMMEEPVSLAAQDIRNARQQVLTQLRPLSSEDLKRHAVFAQYVAGPLNPVSYQDHPHIKANSQTETAVALKLHVDNERWQDMPIYVRAGKQLAKTVTQISIHFKEPSNQMFRLAGFSEHANVLTLRIQPNEGAIVTFQAKKPGLSLKLQEVPMKFTYDSAFEMGLVEAYVKLMYDAVQGDTTLFPRADGIETSWQFVEPLIEHHKNPEFELAQYQAGSWGPKEFDQLIGADGKNWLNPKD